ncbi:Histidine phosphatase superfamilyclade-2 [Penicillium daleae]|uniref:Histidine phosphatase superfamilyclade-2 n=1 Tax=Penicillium daleae TaxID=63821 RepID=A0AAD6CFF2_9EURO|nr:Histidine phosphatase superfamilyclade-2 [Penicillium daleae]KAJ5464386.1 Histidine phosphatase superfamilyclade-2 [Penicillium daleae]
MTVHQSTTMALLALASSHAAAMAVSSSSSTSPAAPTGTSYASGFDMTTSWGNLSPYSDAPGFDAPKGYPMGCELSQVHVLHRHAQRYPSSWPTDGGGMETFAQKVANYSKRSDGKVGSGPLAFLNDWEYLLGENLLLATGAATEATAGALFWSMYGRLLYHAGPGKAVYDSSMNVYPNGTARPKPTFRTTSYPRILESARWWLSGFFGNTGANSSYAEYDLTIIPEERNFNNTLSSTSACTNGSDVGDYALAEFLPSLTNAAHDRFSKFLPDDFNLTSMDVYAMFSMCPYEYATLGHSSFCTLFTEQEWKDFEYAIDLSFYANFGYGAPSGRAQGIGYVQELAARLQSRLIMSSDSSINYTYDDNTRDFPLGQPIYMDMSHDNVIIAVLAALGLDYFKAGPHGLPTTVQHSPSHHFKAKEVSPFGARLFTEVWTCPKDVSFDQLQEQIYKNPDLSSQSGTTDHIRFVLNNAPVSAKGLCDDAVNGFCRMEEFLKKVPGLDKDAMYQEACFGDYNITTQVANGQPIQ